ncbi:30S ribosome-binding factor RbfA [Desulfurivibrio alkaliphilus]|uniref:Ribosome-binding factor A n=1 Tax=Desulfurivibrio alkaliphilus (strain DSM 19089 / UNIQEM U267 / AHT2) TaxID=589865 RepID=D6Z4T4_DESAT|nr:30S ribosome-binding factor RbfA [Desulfurivibrio alkaliphilus]ADH86559.1 ribosome-binding factor A [Desulfurivibrio alkaliphilus AHT 2]
MSAARRKTSLPPLPGLPARTGKRRPDRIADEIRQEVAALLVAKVQDPRVAKVTILRATVTPDLSQARLYYSVFDEAAAAEAAKGLASAKGFIRSSLAKNLALRVVPALIFEHDRSLAEQEKLERIFQEIKAGEEE